MLTAGRPLTGLKSLGVWAEMLQDSAVGIFREGEDNTRRPSSSGPTSGITRPKGRPFPPETLGYCLSLESLTGRCCAGLLLSQLAAGLAVALGDPRHLPGSATGAASTGFAAGRPLRPGSNLAVHVTSEP